MTDTRMKREWKESRSSDGCLFCGWPRRAHNRVPVLDTPGPVTMGPEDRPMPEEQLMTFHYIEQCPIAS